MHLDIPTDYVFIKDMYEVFVISEYFMNLSKEDKRMYSLKDFTEKIRNNLFIRPYFKERDSYINKEKINQPAITGFIKNND